MTFSVAAALDRRVAALEVPHPPDGRWHPSNLFGCARQAIYKIRGTEQSNPPDARAKRVFRVGHELHELIQKAVRFDTENEVVLESYEELPIAIPDLNIAGSADQLVQLRNGRWVLLEYKSVKTASLRYKDLPQEDHVGQAATYMLGLRNHGSVDPETGAVILPPLGDELDVGRICYVSKDDIEVSEHFVHWSPAKEADIRQRVGRLEAHRVAGTLPERLPLVTKDSKSKGRTVEKDWRCRYCPFMTKCWDEDPA